MEPIPETPGGVERKEKNEDKGTTAADTPMEGSEEFGNEDKDSQQPAKEGERRAGESPDEKKDANGDDPMGGGGADEGKDNGGEHKDDGAELWGSTHVANHPGTVGDNPHVI